MAHLKIVLNQKGQALTEALIASFLILPTAFLFIVFFIHQTLSIAIDDSLETYFYCQIQKKENCQLRLLHDLEKINLLNIKIEENNAFSDFEITLYAETKYNYEIHKKRRLSYQRKIP